MSIVFALAGLGLLVYLAYKRFKPAKKAAAAAPVWLLLGSGSAWSLRSVRVEGYSLYDNEAEYPLLACQLIDTDIGKIYMFAADAVQLADYELFSSLKRKNIKGALFKPAGDMVTMLQTVGAVLVISAAIYSYTQTSGISGTLVKQQAQLDKVTELLSKPLVIAK